MNKLNKPPFNGVSTKKEKFFLNNLYKKVNFLNFLNRLILFRI
jgi:hypothetical protein